MIVALAGGVGAAKLLLGLSHVIPPEEITVIVNTGDDLELLGLRICPDLDTIAYTLSGKVNPETGWGVQGDTLSCLETLSSYGWESWFKLGDRDLATHLWRTHLLKQGFSLTEVTRRICTALGVRSQLLPMTELYVPTHISSPEGELHLQEYLVRHQTRPRVNGLRYLNIERCRPSPGVDEAISEACKIIICPSNPFISIGPILAVPGLKECLTAAAALVVAVTPIVAGQALKGPAAKLLSQLGYPVSARGVAEIYSEVADVFVLDQKDAGLRQEIEELGMRVCITDTIMNTLEQKRTLAQTVCELA